MSLCKTQKEVKKVKRKRIHSEGSGMDDSGRKGQPMREKEKSYGGEKYEDMSHCTRVSFFSDLSLQCPVPGEKRGMELWGGMKRKSERCRI